MPPGVEAANQDLPARRVNLLRAWGLNFRRKEGGTFPRWHNEGGKDASTALRQIAAGMAVFAERDGPADPFTGEDWALFSGLDPASSKSAHREQFVRLVENYFDAVAAVCTLQLGSDGSEQLICRQVGTQGVPGKDHADYDFKLRDVVALIHAFVDSPHVLTNRMIRKLIGQDKVSFSADGEPPSARGTVPFSGQNLDEWLATGPNGRHFIRQRFPPKGIRLGVYKASTPETENHLMGIWAWRFLVNEYLFWAAGLPENHPRFDARLKALYDSDPDRYTNHEVTFDFVLQLLGRIPRAGLFEANARPYQSITLMAVMAFYAASGTLFPTDPTRQKVRTAAQNALDYLAAEFAFQSLQGKRVAPSRRQKKHAGTIGFYASDYLADIFGALTGAYVFSDTNGAAETNPNPCTDPDRAQPCWATPYHWDTIGENGGYALWALLSGYQVPRSVHGFLLHKHGGYFARVVTRYSAPNDSSDGFVRGAYPTILTYHLGLTGEPDDPAFARPRYFQQVRDGEVAPADYDIAAEGPRFEPVTQLYFTAPHYVNSSGGNSSAYYEFVNSNDLPGWFSLFEDVIPDAYKSEYDTLSRPSTIVGRGNLQFEDPGDVSAFEALLPTMRGKGKAFAESRNLHTYKNVSLGYTFDEDDEDRHLEWPQRYPPEWDTAMFDEIGYARVVFRVFDFRNWAGHPLHGHYWVLARFSKSDSGGQFREYGRGLWEVVPGHMFPDAPSLAARVQEANPSGHFDDDPGQPYKYRMASTGELLEIHNRFGSSATERGIVAITAANGASIPLEAFTADLGDEDSMRRLPLLDVWQVDRDYHFTGSKYAHADGRGRVTVHNPFVGETLFIDSVDYRSPARFVDSEALIRGELPEIPGTAGQTPNIAALALGDDLLYVTHFATTSDPANFSPVPGQLLALDRRTLGVVNQVTVGRQPRAMALHRSAGLLFVANYGDSSLTVLDSSSLGVFVTIPLAGWGLRHVAVSEKHNRVFVAQYGQQRLLVIDTTTLASLPPVEGLAFEGSLAVDDTTDTLYTVVTNAHDSTLQDVVEFRIGQDTPQEIRRTTVDAQPSIPSELFVDAERIYVVHSGPRPGTDAGPKLTTFHRSTLEMVAVAPLPSPGVAIATSASQQVAYVATMGEVLTLDTETLRTIRRVPLPQGGQSAGAATVAERTGTVFFAGWESNAIIGTATVTLGP